ncbi:SpaH/EbpB family LPXTG-anchored major pilin [Actinomyces sp. B33]|uniref:SpaH/EbpB family LPXTG-anchored major pilin n=1 Tax=Actinomyces sp. B33 TaxID=2942131 RepID=UPI002341EBC2|nr:SpaH/EbpB family LPXTG-anchored major pilin [Actinomyces sp. B33]MDC4233911.1 SpaH/EbpB family LPXTG-anchored major pilin [Actinomyces sp. B33]
MSTHKTRRGVSLLAAVAIAAGGFALPVAAFADNTPDADPSGDGVAAVQINALVNLDKDARGTLTIEKHDRTDANGTTAGNGLADPGVTGNLLDGVKYKIERLTTVDLTTQAGWEKLAGYAGNVATAKADGTDAAIERTTGDDSTGVAKFTNLPLGAYVVTEVSAPSGYTLSDPFIVTVPMTHPTNLNEWNYDPIVYPKNAKVEIDKTVDDEDAYTVGDDIDYTLKSDIPNLPGTQTLDYYAIIDEYDSRMTLKGNSVVLTLDDSTALVAGQDYTLAEITNAFDQDGDGVGTVMVKRATAEFTESGRAKILKARRDGTSQKVTMKLTTTITSPIAGDGVVPNIAIVLPNKPSNNWDPKTNPTPPPDTPPTDKVESKYGKVKITKEDSTTSTKKLADAEFQVYRCTTQEDTAINLNGQNFVTGDYKLVGDPLTAFAVAADGTASQTEVNTFKTAADGTITIDALKNNDWTNGKVDDTPDAYCLVETKAPAGYELQPRPIAFQILESNSTSDNKYTLMTTVKDVPSNGGFKLPLTGAAGVGVLLTAGALLVGGSAAIAYANKRRKDQEA